MKTSRSATAMLMVFVALVYMFLYIPLIILVINSFKTSHGFSLYWYYELLQAGYLWRAFFNSVIIAAAATLLSITMTMALIYYYTTQSKRRGIYFFTTNTVMPEIVVAVGLLTLFSFFKIPFGLFTLIIAHTLLALGYVIPLIYARFITLDVRLLEASADLGATTRETFFTIIMPLLKPTIIAAGLLVFILSFDDFILSFFCAGSESQTLSLYIFSMLRAGTSPILNALSTILLLVSSVLVFVFCLLNSRVRIW